MKKNIKALFDLFDDARFEEIISKDTTQIRTAFLRLSRNVYHSFVPHARNNHRAALLHHVSILGAIWIITLLSLSLRIIHIVDPAVLGISYSISSTDLLNLTNQSRSEYGLSKLQINKSLSEAAQQKANDMFLKNYWAHYAPDGTTPWNFIKNAGYNYVYAGENLAKGFSSSSDVVTAWLNSPSHRENVLSNKYSDIGFAVVEGHLLGEETVLVVEMFGSSQIALAQASESETNVLPTPTFLPTQIPVPTEVIPTLVPSSPTIVEVVPQPLAFNNTKVQAGESAIIDMQVISRPLINLVTIPKSITLAILGFFLFAFLVDLVIIERRKIPRIVGHNLDHIMLISFLILYILLARSGAIF